MNLFNKMFGNEDIKVNASSAISWNALTQLKQLEEIKIESARMPVIIFKHSTRCGISNMSLRQFEKEYDIDSGDVKLYFLDLLQYRNISDEVASRFRVIHQSPQLIMLKNGEVAYHASHGDISAERVKELVEK